MEKWYLLYGGTSEDGQGVGSFASRTTDKAIARTHLMSILRNPYSVGYVLIVSDDRDTHCRSLETWHFDHELDLPVTEQTPFWRTV